MKRENSFSVKFEYYRKQALKEKSCFEAAIMRALENLCAEMGTVKVIDEIKKSKLLSPTHEIAMGYVYARLGFVEGVRVAVYGSKVMRLSFIWNDGLFHNALEYLEKADALMPKSVMISQHLLFCYMMVGDFEKGGKAVTEFARLYDDLDFQHNLRDIAWIKTLDISYVPFTRLRRAELSIISQDRAKMRSAEQDLESLIEEQPNNGIAILLLSYVYTTIAQPGKYEEILKSWSEVEPNPIAFEALGRFYLARRDYTQASEYLDLASQGYKGSFRENICTSLNEFSKALAIWPRDVTQQEAELDSPYKHLLRCSEIIIQHDIESFENLKTLPIVFDFTIRILELFSSSDDLYELKLKVAGYYEELTNLVSRVGSFDESIEHLRILGDPTSNLIVFARLYLQFLGSVLKVAQIEKDIVAFLDETGENNDTFWNENFNMMGKIVSKDLKFSEYQNYLECLLLFKQRIGDRRIDEIPDIDHRSIIQEVRIKSERFKSAFRTREADNLERIRDEIKFEIRKFDETIEKNKEYYVLKTKEHMEEFIAKLDREKKPSFALKVGIENGQPCVKANDETIRLKESNFARFLLCLASFEKGQKSVTFEELCLSRGRQELTPINDSLRKFNIRLSSKSGRVYLKAPKRIVLDRASLCQFESEHYKWTKENVTRFFKEMPNMANDMVSEEGRIRKAEKLLEKLGLLVSGQTRGIKEEYVVSTKVTSVVRNTDLIKNAVEIMGWEFKDERWRTHWSKFKEEIDRMLHYAGQGSLAIYFTRRDS